ncbi:hypothetical protein [Streptomyces longwoodensis]|uniref:hypothetical protein n=1 Tax=Streptomyces longwoodensis TaxID=68231 RepID=UPI0032541F09
MYKPSTLVSSRQRAAWMAWTAGQECPKRSSSVALTAASVSNASIRMNRSPLM